MVWKVCWQGLWLSIKVLNVYLTGIMLHTWVVVFWVAVLCSLFVVYQCFGGSVFLWNIYVQTEDCSLNSHHRESLKFYMLPTYCPLLCLGSIKKWTLADKNWDTGQQLKVQTQEKLMKLRVLWYLLHIGNIWISEHQKFWWTDNWEGQLPGRNIRRWKIPYKREKWT